MFAGVLLLIGCAATPRGGARPADPPEHAGAPVEDVRFANLLEWRPFDADHVLLRFDRGRYVLVEPMDPCFADVREASQMQLRQSVPNRLHRFDRIVLDGRDCRIVALRPFDHAAWRSAAANQDPGGT